MTSSIKDFYLGIRNSIPEEQRVLIDLIFYTILIVLYCLFIWKFYKFMCKREILELNLRQYNESKHPSLEKFLAILLYTLEYLIILPFMVLFWFIIFSAFLMLLSEIEDVHQILLISAAIITSTRITAYISKSLSEDLAKIFPLTLLVTYLLNPNFLGLSKLVERFFAIPTVIKPMIIFMAFIIIVEFGLRAVYSITKLIKSNRLSRFAKIK